MDIKEAFSKLNGIFEDFKKENDKALEQKAEKGHVDPLITEKLDKLNAAMDGYQKQVDDFQARMNHLDLIDGNSDEAKNLVEELAAFGEYTGRTISSEAYAAYKPAFEEYLRVGDQAMGREAMAALHVGSDPKGGYYVTPDKSGKIVKFIRESSPMRPLADVISIGTDALEGLRDLDEAASGGWVGERQSRSETDTPETAVWRVPAHEQFAQPKATQKMLDDSGIDIEVWLEGKVGRKISRVENTAFVSGTGSLKPRGFLTYPEGTPAGGSTAAAYEKIKQFPSGKSAGFATTNPGDKIIDMTFGLKAAYRRNATWVMTRTTLGKTRQLKDGQGNYLWLPGTFADQVVNGTLNGRPIEEFADMPELAANSLSIALADWKQAYLIVDRTGIRVLRDPFTDKPHILFYTTKRVGGDVSDFDAIKIMKFAVSV